MCVCVCVCVCMRILHIYRACTSLKGDNYIYSRRCRSILSPLWVSNRAVLSPLEILVEITFVFRFALRAKGVMPELRST